MNTVAVKAAGPGRPAAGLSERAAQKFRRRRMDLFLGLASRVARPARLLDVGGTTAFWAGLAPEGLSVTLLNLFAQEPPEGGEALVGDACDLSRFSDGSFDIVFSNSVLCLVGGWENQRRMAAEIRRVGWRYFVQTANRRFLLDWRTLVPFFHWLPPAAQGWCLQRFPVGRYSRAANPAAAWELATRVQDLTRPELKRLFPEGTIVSERVLGVAKSFMIHHGFDRHTSGACPCQ